MFTKFKTEELSSDTTPIIEIVDLDMDALCVVAGGDGTRFPHIGP